jgi:hypothetical protein
MTAVGTLRGLLPYVRFGTGPAALVVLPGMAFDNPVPGSARARTYGWAMRRLAVGRTVTVLQRPRGIINASTDKLNGTALETTDLAEISLRACDP